MTAGRLDGRCALVTGGASGLGEGIVRRFVAEGAAVVVADLDEARARDLAVRELGRLDVMVNNAGVLGATGSLLDTDAADWDRTLAVLLRSVFLGIKHAGRVMRTQRSGSIINTASTAGVWAGLAPHAYTAAKHAVVGLTGNAAVELAPHRVRVNALAPGATISAMTAALLSGSPSALTETGEVLAAASPGGRAVTPAEIGAAAAYLAADESWCVSGACLVLDGGNEVLATQGRSTWP